MTAFVSKGVLDMPVEKFNITPTDKPQEDLAKNLG